MGWDWISGKPNVSKQITTLNKRVKDLTQETRTINESLVSINHTNTILSKVKKTFEAADFATQKSKIDALELDEKYKEKPC